MAFRLPSWGAPLPTLLSRYIVLYGGRSSAKTWTVAHVLLMKGFQQKLRISITREYRVSIEQSAKQTLEIGIANLGLQDFYRVSRFGVHGANGTEFFLQGIERNRENIRGWENLDIVWVEEAQRMTERTWEVLRPTLRKPGSQIWITFNPESRSDPVWQTFVQSRPPPNSFVLKVNYNMNPFLTPEAEAERLDFLAREPERYPNVWLGEPNEESRGAAVIPYDLLELAVRHYKPEHQGPFRTVGLDVADLGVDRSAHVVAASPTILEAHAYHARSTAETFERADQSCREAGVKRMYYDAMGVGAGVRSELIRSHDRPYSAVPVNFGGKVRGPKRSYTRKYTNGEFFSRWNAQLAWGARLRALRTRRWVEGGVGKPRECLFINPKIPRLGDYLAALAQPIWSYTDTKQIRIDKAPEGRSSPDLYDATVLALAGDTMRGLKER